MEQHSDTGAPVAVELVIDGGVVVGNDGSAAARAALRWAADDAARRATTLHVVRCWSLRTAPRPATWQAGYVPPLEDWDAAVREELLRDRALIGEFTDLDVQWHTVHAGPGPVLARATRNADLVVVGSHGHSELRELLLGSVAEYVLHHAHGPVVVVHAGGRGADDER